MLSLPPAANFCRRVPELITPSALASGDTKVLSLHWFEICAIFRTYKKPRMELNYTTMAYDRPCFLAISPHPS